MYIFHRKNYMMGNQLCYGKTWRMLMLILWLEKYFSTYLGEL
jgi:hypothetical protein